MYILLKKLKTFVRKLAPKSLLLLYHRFLVFFAALVYRFPAKKIFVLGVTGTKGKTSVLELINSILEAAGHKTAIISTLRFKIASASCDNNMKMTMPGRFYIQRFLRSAVKRGCDFVLIEMTSQGVLQFRHNFLFPNAVIFTNLSPEHVESHGSFEKYRGAKLEIIKSLEDSPKKNRTLIVNGDDENARYFLDFKISNKLVYGKFDHVVYGPDIKDFKIQESEVLKSGIEFFIEGHKISSRLLGKFNLYNILAAVCFVRSLGIAWDIVEKGVWRLKEIPGRVEFIEKGQNFKVVVDYAHTPDSLEQLYLFFKDVKKICVLGSAGGGRDKWKRSEMGRIAAENCSEIILTDEDPYDENPLAIIKDVAGGIKSPFKYKIMPDRRKAIREALQTAKADDVVLITGKGTDPFIMGPAGGKIKWDDRAVVKEELVAMKKL